MKKKTTLALKEESASPQEIIYTPEQIELIKNTVAKNSTDDELALFMQVAKRSGLDPFTKQVHFVKRRSWNQAKRQFDEVGTIITGIDGYRAIAVRSGELAGIDDAVFDDETKEHPNKATVSVYRLVNGVKYPFTASARWNEYCAKDKDGNPTGQWKKMPYLMLAKVAEALALRKALRKAFPNDLSGLYTSEEMSQSDNEHEKVAQPAPREVVAQTEPVQQVDSVIMAQKSRIKQLLSVLNTNKPLQTGSDYMQVVADLTSMVLSEENYAEIITRLEILLEERNRLAYE